MSYDIKQRDNGVFYLEYRDDAGKRKRLSLKTRNRKHAERAGRDLFIEMHVGTEDEVDQQELPPVARRRGRNITFTLGDAIHKMQQGRWHPDNCRSWVTIHSDCRILLDFFGDVEVTEIQASDIQAFANHCKVEGLAPGTIKKRLSRLRSLFSKCATGWINPDTKQPYLPYIPEFPENIETPQPRKRELTEGDERRVLDYCQKARTVSTRGQQWWLFEQFLIWQIDTGMRRNETLNKTLDDIKGDVVMLYGEETKNRQGREVPLTSRVQRMVSTFCSMNITGPIFGGMTKSKLYEMWHEVREALDLGDITIHDLRHTRGQRLADAGVPLEVIADLLGHKDISVTARVYTFRKGETLRKWTDFAEQGNVVALSASA